MPARASNDLCDCEEPMKPIVVLGTPRKTGWTTPSEGCPPNPPIEQHGHGFQPPDSD